jgi:F0F1-type ATP synthase assembly protein I
MPPASPTPSPDRDSLESKKSSVPQNPTESRDADEGNRQRSMRDYSRYSSVGVTFGVVLALFAFAGYWADKQVGSSPIFLVLGVFVGFGGGLYSLIRKIPVSSRGRRKRPPT